MSREVINPAKMSYVEEETIKMVEHLRAMYNNCDEDGVEVPIIIDELRNLFGDKSIKFQTLGRCCELLEPEPETKKVVYDLNEVLVLKAFVYYVRAYCSYLAQKDGYVEEWVLKEMPRTPCPTVDKLNAALDNVIATDRIKNGT